MSDTFPRTKEQLLLWTFLVLHFTLLFVHWGNISGHDALEFLGTLKDTNLFGPLPDLYTYRTSYHPPLSFLLAKLLSFSTGNLITGTQLLSSASILGTFLLLRSTLRQINLLQTTPGVIFLYLSSSLPLYVYLSRAITYDSLQFFFTILTLHLSIRFFWQHSSTSPPRRNKASVFLPLAVVLTAGLFTKYSALLNFSLPLFVILIRFHKPTSRASLASCLLAWSIAISASAPFYYTRYYQREQSWMPIGMEWQRKEDVSSARTLRDAHPILFILYVLRMPENLFLDEYPLQDSLWHRLWFDMWKGDPSWGPQTKASDVMSTFYATTFIPLFLLGLFLFILKKNRSRSALSDFGWILFLQGALSCAALLIFAYQYPLFDWGVFKAKYIPIALLFATYCIAIATHFIRQYVKWITSSSIFIGLLIFMMANHLLPVY